MGEVPQLNRLMWGIDKDFQVFYMKDSMHLTNMMSSLSLSDAPSDGDFKSVSHFMKITLLNMRTFYRNTVIRLRSMMELYKAARKQLRVNQKAVAKDVVEARDLGKDAGKEGIKTAGEVEKEGLKTAGST